MSSDQKPDDEEAGQFASPPCFMHEIDPAYGGLAPDQTQARDVARWRKIERERLIAARLAKSPEARNESASLIVRDLDTIVPEMSSTVISLYWPFRGEPDLRPWMAAACARGLRVALPIVIAKAQPLEFREWIPGARMERGVWNIPYPADGDVVTPTVVIAPLVGFDPEGYRLGYGGGFFDRTLAALPAMPMTIGVGYSIGAIPTIFPQWHDLPMTWIVTGHEAPRQRSIAAGQKSVPRK